MATNNYSFLESNPRGKRGLDFAVLMSNLWDWMWGDHQPITMGPEEMRSALLYQERRDRLREPNPIEGEASPARTCFFLRKDAETQEFWSIDTEAQQITRLAFFAKWEGQDAHYDLEIGTPKP